MADLSNLPRRHVLTAGAWSAPAVVLASTTPAYAASNAVYALSVPPVVPAGAVTAVVSMGGAALPVVPGTVTLTLERLSQTGTISSANFAGTWTYEWSSPGLFQLFATSSVMAISNFSVTLTAPATWRFTLTTPTETISQDVEVVAAAGRVQSVPFVDDPSMTTTEPEW